jgi:hypothetical protein
VVTASFPSFRCGYLYKLFIQDFSLWIDIHSSNDCCSILIVLILIWARWARFGLIGLNIFRPKELLTFKLGQYVGPTAENTVGCNIFGPVWTPCSWVNDGWGSKILDHVWLCLKFSSNIMQHCPTLVDQQCCMDDVEFVWTRLNHISWWIF